MVAIITYRPRSVIQRYRVDLYRWTFIFSTACESKTRAPNHRPSRATNNPWPQEHVASGLLFLLFLCMACETFHCLSAWSGAMTTEEEVRLAAGPQFLRKSKVAHALHRRAYSCGAHREGGRQTLRHWRVGGHPTSSGLGWVAAT